MNDYRPFPRTTLGGISVPRMIMGTNWLLGTSHTSNAADQQIKARYPDHKSLFPVIEEYMKYGINMFYNGPPEAIKYAEDKLGKEIINLKLIMIDPADNAQARHESEEKIKQAARDGAKFVFLFHAQVEELVDKHAKKIRRIGDYTKMIRDAGMIPGFSAHMPEIIIYSDENDYDVEGYIQIFNCMGFMMQVEIEFVARIIHNAKHPVIAIKPMAAGRVSPYVGLTFCYNAIREKDMVCVGAYDEMEVAEDVEIARAALDRRFPDIPLRNSLLFAEQAVLGTK